MKTWGQPFSGKQQVLAETDPGKCWVYIQYTCYVSWFINPWTIVLRIINIHIKHSGISEVGVMAINLFFFVGAPLSSHEEPTVGGFTQILSLETCNDWILLVAWTDSHGPEEIPGCITHLHFWFKLCEFFLATTRNHTTCLMSVVLFVLFAREDTNCSSKMIGTERATFYNISVDRWCEDKMVDSAASLFPLYTAYRCIVYSM